MSVDQAWYNKSSCGLVSSPEIRFAFDYPVRQPLKTEVRPLSFTKAISLVDFFDIQQKCKERLLSVLPDLYAIYSDGRETIEKSLIRDMAFLATSGIVTIQELEKLFECCRSSWSEYWSESEFNYRIHSIFEPKTSCNLPHEKHISLENAYHQANRIRCEGKRVVVGMGTFDFHSGHADFFNDARDLAGNGVLLAFVTSDEEALENRWGEPILKFKQRLDMVASHHGVDFCVGLPWKNEYKDPDIFDFHMKAVHYQLGAHFRLIGELDERSSSIENQCKAGGTTLVYRRKERVGDISSTSLRRKLA